MKKILFILFVIGCIANSNAQVPSYVPTDGLVAYYPFNGNANDESGNGNNGSVIGSTELTNDRLGQTNSAYDFDLEEKSWAQRNNEIYIPYSSQFNSSNLTVSAWVYPRSYFDPANSNDKASIIISRTQYGYSNPNGQVWSLYFNDIQTSGVILEAAPNNSQSRAYATYNTPLTLNSWHHIVMTFDGSSLKLYIDNNLVADTSTTIVMNNEGTSGLSIGVSNQANGWWYDADAKIDDIGLWNRALTEQEVANLYTSNNTSSDTDFLTFSLDDEIEESNINLDEHTIDLKVYSNINITSLIPSFTVSDGAIVKVDDELQESDVTSNDFTDSVIYRVISQDGTIEQNWTVSVKNNNKPVIVDDYFTITEDSDNEFIFNITENDIDSDGDMVTVINSLNVIEGYKGGYEINDDGNLIFTPNPNACGETVLEYKITDSYEESDVGLITINIEPIHDDTPVARDDTYTVFKNSDVIEIDVLNNDFDPDNLCGEKVDSLTILYAVSSGPGEISVSENNLLLNYKPGNNFSGIEEITYIITDGDNDAVGKLIVTVNNELMELQEILNLTFTTGTGGTNRQDDFGQKSYDIFSDMLSSDMALSTSTYGWYRASITEYQATQDFTLGHNRQVWRYYYRIITRCNFLIDKINSGNIDSSDQTESVLGQVKTLRAYAYFYLTQFFQNEYNGSEKILPILLHDGDYYQELRTANEIYDLVESDLQEAIALLDGFTRSSKTEIDKSIALAIYAYVLGARGTDPLKAHNIAVAAISGGYTLMSATEITGGFNNVATPGWMWGVDLNDEIGLGLVSWWGQMDYFAYSYAAYGDAKSMDQGLFDAIPANDARKAQYNDAPGTYEHLMPLGKFYNAARTRYGVTRIVQDDYVYMRVAEMHLLAAEMGARAGNDAAARTYLKNVVSQRVPDASYIDALSGNALLDEIYLQTRIELWGEGKSYLAMKRNKATVTRGSNHLSFVGEPIRHNDDRLTFEIPQGFGFTPNDPKVYLIGVDQYTINLGETFNDPGAFAVDSEDNDISENITITGSIDNNTEGEYTLVYSVSDSLGRSAIPKFRTVVVERNTLGLVDSKKIEFSIFPNPSKDIINIKSEEELKSIEIYSILGEKVMFFEKKIQQLNIKNLSKGIYIMKLITNQGSAFKKFVKN